MRDQKECSAVHFVGAPDIPTFQRGRAWYAQYYEHHISTILYYTILYYTAVYNQVPLQCARLAGRRILGFGVPVHKSDSSICGTKNKVVGGSSLWSCRPAAPRGGKRAPESFDFGGYPEWRYFPAFPQGPHHGWWGVSWMKVFPGVPTRATSWPRGSEDSRLHFGCCIINKRMIMIINIKKDSCEDLPIHVCNGGIYD